MTKETDDISLVCSYPRCINRCIAGVHRDYAGAFLCTYGLTLPAGWSVLSFVADLTGKPGALSVSFRCSDHEVK